MGRLLRILWALYRTKAQVDFFVHAKRRAVVAYLNILQGGRRLLVVAFAAFLILQAMLLAGFGALVTGFILWDYDYHSKMVILFFIFLGLFVIPLGLLVWLLSERTWYRLSGAAKLVDDILD